jgi:hypothetical protein
MQQARGEFKKQADQPTLADSESDEPDARSYVDLIGNKLWCTSTSESFLDPELFRREADLIAPGLKGRCKPLKPLRAEFVRHMFVKDVSPSKNVGCFGMLTQMGLVRCEHLLCRSKILSAK